MTPRLAALVRKELIRPEGPQLAGEDGFRFRHLLIRDAAYDGLPKATRAELHQRFATWLENNGGDLVELDEVLGYHLEQAWRYRRELGLADDVVFAAEARQHLTVCLPPGRRQDYAAGVNLFERAAALVPEAEIDLALEHELGYVLLWGGRVTTRYGALIRSPSGPLRRTIVSASSAGGSRRNYPPLLAPRAGAGNWPCWSRRRYPYSRPPATISRFTSDTPRLGRWQRPG